MFKKVISFLPNTAVKPLACFSNGDVRRLYFPHPGGENTEWMGIFQFFRGRKACAI